MRLAPRLAAVGLLLAPLAACVSPPAPAASTEAAGPPSASDSGLAGTSWELVQFQSSDDAIGTIKPTDPSRYRLELKAGGELALRLDCNRAAGRWSAQAVSSTDGLMSLDAPAMTRAECGEGAMDTRIARDLPRVVSYTLRGDTLNLALKVDSGIYTWRRLQP